MPTSNMYLSLGFSFYKLYRTNEVNTDLEGGLVTQKVFKENQNIKKY